MFSALDWARRFRLTHTTGEKTMATVLALERNNPYQHHNQFARSLRSSLQNATLVTSRTRHLATHSM